MEAFLSHPAVQGGIAPFVVGLIVALALGPLRLGGLAAAAGFAAVVWLIEGFQFTPLNATRKIILLTLIAPLVGILVDLAFRPTRIGYSVIAIAVGAGAVWAFLSVLGQKEMAQALLLGAGIAVFTAWLCLAMLWLSETPLPAGAAALGLGLGTGIAAIAGASAKFGQFAMALGAGAGGLLLVQMLRGRAFAAGATLVLPLGLGAGLLATGAVVLGSMPWYALLPLAAIPLAARIPGPRRRPVWMQTIVLSLYTIATAAAAVVLSWQPWAIAGG